MIYDVAIIGAGIIGSCIARELSKSKLNICMIDKADDVACGTSKANSGIIHGGFDAKPGTLMAKLNVEGTAMYPQLSEQLHFDYKNNGSLVVGFCDEDMEHIKKLYQRGKDNGVEKLRIIDQEELRKLEPNISEEAVGALLSETAGIVSPYQATWAFAENALMNGVKVFLEQEVHSITVPEKNGDNFILHTGRFDIEAKIVVNAAGLYADEIAKLAGDDTFTITPRKGEYILFDKTACNSLVYGVVFPCPTKKSKGILVCTTTHGNTFIGPNANEQDSKEDLAVTTNGMNEIMASARKLIPNLPMGASITEFAGLRAVSSTGDFIIGLSDKVENLYNAAGMQSPGLTAAPAVGELIGKEIARVSGAATKADFKAALPKKKSFVRMTPSEQAAKIAEDKLYGRVICRCETVTEGEIVEAIKSPVGARTVDGVKRRTRAGMGRCQGGFCGPRVTQILARELGISIPEVLKERADSNMFYEKYPVDGGEE